MSDIPEDEMLLAEMIAFAEDRGLNHCNYTKFLKENNAVCAAGCILYMFTGSPTNNFNAIDRSIRDNLNYHSIAYGNDEIFAWTPINEDNGESLGWAYRQAMTTSKENNNG